MKNFKNNTNFFHKLSRRICFFGGADLEELNSYDTDHKNRNVKNGFLVVGIIVFILTALSVFGIFSLLEDIIQNKILICVISSVFGFIIFVSYWAVLSIGNKSTKISFIVKSFISFTIITISFIITAGIINKYFILSYDNIIKNKFTYLIIFLSVCILYILPIILRNIINRSKINKFDDIFNIILEAENQEYIRRHPEHIDMIIADSLREKHIKMISNKYSEYITKMNNMIDETFDFLVIIDEKIEINKKKGENQKKFDENKIDEIINNVYEILKQASKEFKESFNNY